MASHPFRPPPAWISPYSIRGVLFPSTLTSILRLPIAIMGLPTLFLFSFSLPAAYLKLIHFTKNSKSILFRRGGVSVIAQHTKKVRCHTHILCHFTIAADCFLIIISTNLSTIGSCTYDQGSRG